MYTHTRTHTHAHTHTHTHTHTHMHACMYMYTYMCTHTELIYIIQCIYNMCDLLKVMIYTIYITYALQQCYQFQHCYYSVNTSHEAMSKPQHENLWDCLKRLSILSLCLCGIWLPIHPNHRKLMKIFIVQKLYTYTV